MVTQADGGTVRDYNLQAYLLCLKELIVEVAASVTCSVLDARRLSWHTVNRTCRPLDFAEADHIGMEARIPFAEATYGEAMHGA